ncbi:hypothetical protein AAE478_003139 [Parahypoxylon ruwenzoriense]
MTPRLDPGPAVLAPPSTPSRRRPEVAEFDIWFLEFSNSYNLNLKRSPPDLSPQKKRSLPYYSELEYYERLKVQYFKGNHLGIHTLFDQRAKDIHGRWVKKPLAALGVTPFPTQLPRATTEPERRQLLRLLRAILDDVGTVSVPSRASVSTSFSHRVSDEPSSPTRRRSKRYSNEWQGSPSPERNRAPPSEIDTEVDPDDERPPSVLSILDRGRVRTDSPVPSRLPSVQPPGDSVRNRGLYELIHSANTSKSTLTSQVFSDHGGDEPPASQETQTTIIASNTETEHAKHPLLSPPRSVAGSDPDSLAPSSSTERALHISFNDYERLQQNSRALSRNGSSIYSDFSYLSEQDITHTATLSPPPISSPASPVRSPREEKARGVPPIAVHTGIQDFEQRLNSVWPLLPLHYDQAPFVVRWEILRISLHCGIQMDNLHLEYDPSWTSQKTLWTKLQALPSFQGKSFPEKSRPEAWAAALNDNFCTADEVVVLTASLTANTSKTGPPFNLRLNPLRLDLPHRLSRRFGSDRFLEVVVPSMGSQALKNFGEHAIESIQRWLINDAHVLLGRVWTSFFIKPSLPKKVSNENTLVPQTKIIHQERIYMFAEDGYDFHRLEAKECCSPKGEVVDKHTKMGRGSLIDWLLQIPNNQEQSVLKLFSRIALGLSRTKPTVILQPEQIRHRKDDIRSPANKVMNDGIARMSRGLAESIKSLMGLKDLPAGFQGRFGSAKGFWILDTTDTSGEIWIETYPSQRKWKCDYIEDDHRTFEVRNSSKELKAANLNLQLLPILEDRAIDTALMKAHVGAFMKDSLQRDLDSQKAAMQDPIQFRLWVYENSPSNRRAEHVKYGEYPFTAGLPTSREDVMSFLVDSGFDPTRLEFLRDMAWKLRKQRCEELLERLNVRVGRSAYAYMVVDFLGVLEEGEVHLGFSSKFTDEQSGFSETFLHGMDVLVARTPAHYPSDIQRVRAVFKPELGALKDVIVFSTRGNIPLADKLSGGDYDGDIAWVCWEPTIVNNFHNAEMPLVPDLFKQGVVRKESQSYSDLLESQDITSEFLTTAFRFNMQQNLLGVCTNYKEKFCYARNSVRDQSAILLSTLISHLVDRAKQGIVFTDRDWAQLRKTLSRFDPSEPRYKKENWDGNGDPTHIIDYVKFSVGRPLIEMELKELNGFLNRHAERFDKDLVGCYHYYEQNQRPLEKRKEDERMGLFKKSTWEVILEQLKKDIDAVAQEWVSSRSEWDVKIANLYDKWQGISPTHKVKSKDVRCLQQEDRASVGVSEWDLLKASFCFKMYYNKYPKFVWYIAGKQLAHLKAVSVSRRTGGWPVLVAPYMYAGSRPDSKYARDLAARAEGRNLFESMYGEEAESLSDEDI